MVRPILARKTAIAMHAAYYDGNKGGCEAKKYKERQSRHKEEGWVSLPYILPDPYCACADLNRDEREANWLTQ